MPHSDPVPHSDPLAHCDPETLAMRAMGWPAPPGEDAAVTDAHLASCPVCQSELDELRAVARTAAATTTDDLPVIPPPRVWDRVAGELALTPTRYGPAAPPAQPRDVTPAGRAPRRPRRIPQWAVTAAAAVLGIIVGIVGTAVTLAVTGDEARQPPVVAEARLAPVSGSRVAGVAHVVGTGKTRRLVLDLGRLPTRDGFYEVWLRGRGASQLVSVGVLVAENGRFRIPSRLDLGTYPVVDVSAEPFDGDPAHSTNSVTRGTLRG